MKNKNIEKFNIINCPLNKSTIIEASAGTGKTYNITGLFLRLIIEKGLSVNQILVMTFTIAATEELKSRIRASISNAWDYFNGNEDKKTELLEHYSNTRAEYRNNDIKKLKQAMLSMDEAAIFTIHGFCNKVLLENAFETGSQFGINLEKDVSELLYIVVSDYWRRNFINMEEHEKYLALLSDITLSDINKAISKIIGRPDIKIGTEITNDFSKAIKNLKKIKEIHSRLKMEFDNIRNSFIKEMETSSIKKNIFNVNRRAKIFSNIELILNSDDEDIVKNFKKLKEEEKKNRYFNIELFLTLADNPEKYGFSHDFSLFLSNFEILINNVKDILKQSVNFKNYHIIKALEFSKKEFKRLKLLYNKISFSDLLNILYDALKNSKNGILKKSINKKFKAALIDEFQDTDAIQYSIFKSLFVEQSELCCFFIGDPKQSIYSFRGADIYAYKRAKDEIKHKFTLIENWRSDKRLIEAVNALFNKENPFLFDWLDYNKVEFPNREEVDFTIGGKSVLSPMKIIQVEKKGEDYFSNICLSISCEIKKIVNSGKINGKNIDYSDIAILVRSHFDGEKIKNFLDSENIHSVIQSKKSIFSSSEAKSVKTILRAVLEPKNINFIKQVLLIDFFPYGKNIIKKSIEGSDDISKLSNRFLNYQKIWNRNGIMPMLMKFFEEEGIFEELLKYSDRERRITNIRHLMGLLQNAEYSKMLSNEGLVKWLSKKITDYGSMDDVDELRIESDESAVQIVTVHVSKGLQYPIVFLPNFFKEKKNMKKEELAVYHSDQNETIISFDKDVYAEKIKREADSESIRLFYVALTRAKHMCYLYSLINDGKPANHKNSAIGLLDIDTRIKDFLKDSNGAIEILNVENTYSDISLKNKNNTKLSCMLIDDDTEKRIKRSHSIKSFSALTAYSNNEKDYILEGENINLSDENIYDRPRIFDFPAGPLAGTFFHSILEELDFKSSRDEIGLKVEEKLKTYGFSDIWKDDLSDYLFELLNSNIKFDGNIMKLSDIDIGKRISELQFYYPVEQISIDSLKKIFSGYQRIPKIENSLSKLEFSDFCGYMNGFIDLVFEYEGKYYLLDWKTNLLGKSYDSYNLSELTLEIERHYYYLQYYFYTVALDKYLKSRIIDYDYKKHFGGIIYLFIRGVSKKDPELGVFFEKLDKEYLRIFS